MKKTLFFIVLTLAASFSADAQISIDDVVRNGFGGTGIGSITPLADGEHYLTMDGRCIFRHSFKSEKEIDTVFNVATVRGQRLSKIDGFTISPTEDRILIQSGFNRIFRNSFSAEYYIYHIGNNRIEPLSGGGPQQAPKFSPDGNVIAFVRDGNIYLVKLLFNNAESQVTKDGEPGSILNGVPDWCYDEEFSISSAYEFSADSKMLAFVRFDCSRVNRFNIPSYQDKVLDSEPQQPLLNDKQIWYPVAGSDYSTVSVHSFDIKSAVTRKMDLDIEDETYVPRIKFVEDDKNTLFVFTINRNQNKLEIFGADPRSTVCNLLLREEDERYIEPEEFLNTTFYGNQFIMESERDGHNHLYLYETNGRLVKQLTKGDWDVLQFHGYDTKSGNIFYTANMEHPYQSALYRQDGKGKATKLSNYNGGNVSAKFSKGLKYYICSWSDLNTPPIVTKNDNSGKILCAVNANADLMKKVIGSGFAKRELFSFQTSAGTTLYGWILKPANMPEGTRYPLLLYQYGGPGSNNALDQWSSGFYAGGALENWLLQDGIVVACVDGRGTGRRGSVFKKQTYLNIGVMESDDQVEAAKYLSTLPYIDSERIGIWGWSYGGYNTLMALSQGTPVFRCGIAVAPVTDWRFYDATYTERFMRTPGQNNSGYESGSAINRIDRLNGRLLIVHGLMDDNVLFTNTDAYITALIEKGVVFDMQLYPNREHSLRGESTRKHLFLKMKDFLDTYLK